MLVWEVNGEELPTLTGDDCPTGWTRVLTSESVDRQVKMLNVTQPSSLLVGSVIQECVEGLEVIKKVQLINLYAMQI